MIGSPTWLMVKNSPGSFAHDARPAHNHSWLNTASVSNAWNSALV
jgi:hypothetical protein